MKKLTFLLLTVLSFTLCGASYAGSLAGKDSARYYKSNPDDFNGKVVDVDCIAVTRINGGAQVEGVVFFVAHTKDDDNKARGGSIVVAVLDYNVDSFLRKYGNTIERTGRGSSEGVESKRLRGTFNVLERGHVYIDMSDGEAVTAISAHKAIARDNISRGEGGALKRRNKLN